MVAAKCKSSASDTIKYTTLTISEELYLIYGNYLSPCSAEVMKLLVLCSVGKMAQRLPLFGDVLNIPAAV